jgi:molybdate transport system regulatory protein
VDNINPAVVRLCLRSYHRIYDESGRLVMGEGRMALLEGIDAKGSINQAAKQLGMSYKSAWSKIRSTEIRLGAKIVHTDRAAGSHLTAAGFELLKRYRRLKRRCLAADDALFDKIFGEDTTG